MAREFTKEELDQTLESIELAWVIVRNAEEKGDAETVRVFESYIANVTDLLRSRGYLSAT